jgi:hypothetical protein
MEAVEFYESTESAKYGFFQDKLTKLLTNNKIYEQMEEESKNNKKSDQKSEETRQASDHSKFNSKKQMELDIMMGEKKNKDMTNELLRVYGTSHVTLDKIVKNNLLSQEKSINQRYSLLTQGLNKES